MKGQGGGGTAKGGGKNKSGGGTIKITRTEERKTKAIDENVITLRKAVFDDNGKDKDVTAGITPAFMKYDRSGLDCDIKFSTKLTSEEFDWAFDLVKLNMEERYDASGYGWDDEDKKNELHESGTRFLLVREKGWDNLIAFAHFRFTVQGEVMDVMAGKPAVFVWDIHVEEEYQRKGLGKHLLTLLELIARRENIDMISIPIQLSDAVASAWISKLKGYGPDNDLKKTIGFDPEQEGFQVFSKEMVKKATATAPAPVLAIKIPEIQNETTTAATTQSLFTFPSKAVDEISKQISTVKIADTTPQKSKVVETSTPSSIACGEEDWVVVNGAPSPLH